jgi:23S rRNA (uracil1939-C5)-methyltransferase
MNEGTASSGTRVESLSHEGRGIARPGGKTVFISGALPGELVRYRVRRRRGRFDEGIVEEILEASPLRRTPPCPHFRICGGCALQHLGGDEQRRHKESVFLEQLRSQTGIAPDELLPPLAGPELGYRRKARLGVKFVAARGRVMVGFHERYSSYIADMNSCAVLHPSLSALLPALADVIGELSVRDAIPQIEAAAAGQDIVLVFRHLRELSAADRDRLRAFGNSHGVQIRLQPGGEDSIRPLDDAERAPLSYRIPEFDLEMNFSAADFTQVNFEINRLLVRRVVDLLSPAADDRVLDLFCGIGNFTLPLARVAAEAIGVEGLPALAEKARCNARLNGLANARFLVADLAGDGLPEAVRDNGCPLVLLDPPRSGARELIDRMDFSGVRRLVYVSCNPATFARDAASLTADRGFRLSRAGIADMFPQTAHVESVALFERK